jgi:alkyl hydroperoxide reductase subunit AhpC
VSLQFFNAATGHLRGKSGIETVMRKVLFPLFLLTCVPVSAEEFHKAPDFSADAVWIDAGHIPRSIKGYRGQVVLIDFWEYTCINCIRDFAVLKRWYSKFHPYGFEIIGVHYGEFAMGYKVANVRDAAKRFRLPWPVIADLKGSVWNAYHSDVWPNRFLVDPQGYISMHLKGEGNDHSMEEKIHELLETSHPEVRTIALDPPENSFSPQCGITTEETYVGTRYGRSAIGNSQFFKEGQATNFHQQQEPADGAVMLSRKWGVEQEGVESASKDDKAELRYHARSIYAVLSVENPKKPIRLDLLQDGVPLTREEAGEDVQVDSRGSYIEVSKPRMYYLVKNPRFGSHLLTMVPENNGFSLHSFTYGNDCQQDTDESTGYGPDR